MRVLLCIRRDYKENLAGDAVQMLTTYNILRRLGVEADISTGKASEVSGYDVVHLFNLTRITETYVYYKAARRLNKPVVITPIFWNLEKYYSFLGDVQALALWKEYAKYRKEILSGALAVYPSSLGEQELLEKEYGGALPCRVIYNALDPETAFSDAAADTTGRESFILCAARICPRKNQLLLAKASHALGVRLVLAGGAGGVDYLQECLAYPNVSWIGFQENEQLRALYGKAALHALASFVETPGLSCLEAGAAGCDLLTTAEGSGREYFGDMALYADPYDESDVLLKLKTGLAFSAQPRLKRHIQERFGADMCLSGLLTDYLRLLR